MDPDDKATGFAATDGYLRDYDDDLSGALELVATDLQTAGLTRTDAERKVWHSAERTLDFTTLIPGELALAVAETLQEHVMMHVASTWPPCPDHPQHPLWLVPGDTADTSWTCAASGTAIARLGELASPSTAP